MLTEKEARQEAARLLSDKDYFLSTVIDNNPTAVAQNLQAMGFQVDGVEDIERVISQLEEDGENEAIYQAISVEPDYANLPDGYDRVFEILTILKNSKNG